MHSPAQNPPPSIFLLLSIRFGRTSFPIFLLYGQRASGVVSFIGRQHCCWVIDHLLTGTKLVDALGVNAVYPPLVQVNEEYHIWKGNRLSLLTPIYKLLESFTVFSLFLFCFVFVFCLCVFLPVFATRGVWRRNLSLLWLGRYYAKALMCFLSVAACCAYKGHLAQRISQKTALNAHQNTAKMRCCASHHVYSTCHTSNGLENTQTQRNLGLRGVNPQVHDCLWHKNQKTFSTLLQKSTADTNTSKNGCVESLHWPSLRQPRR